MTELANYVAAGMPTNYNAVHGYGFNPYDPRRDPRTTPTAGRSCRPAARAPASAPRRTSGPATSARETSGSILSPSNQNMLAAIKPTVGRISRYGVIPITADQDTPGPMAKYVMDVGDHVRRARERVARSERSGDEGVHAAARPRLHEAAARRRAEGRAHRHPARELLRPDHAAGLRSRRAAASTPSRRR